MEKIMDESEKKGNSADLEDTVRSLREQNAKLIQILRLQGLLVDSNDNKHPESSNIKFENSDVTLSTNSISTTNQITHQHVNNHGPINQQNYAGQTIHGNQSNITPNFNTVIQTTSQPFVQNNSNTLVQNNTNLIQPINLVNFNNVNLDSLQSFFASQNNLLYLSQPSSSSTTTTTVTTTTTSNLNLFNESEQHQISIRPKPSLIPQHQDLHPVLPKAKSEHFDYPTRQLSTPSNSETTNLLDNDLNHKQPRPIRPKPSSRINSLQIYPPIVHNESKPMTTNVLPPSLLTNGTPSSTVSILSPSTSFDEHHSDVSPQLLQSKSLDLSIPPTNNLLTTMKKPTKNATRNRKKPPPASSSSAAATTTTTTITSSSSSSSAIPSLTSSSLVPIAPNPGRPLAPAPLNVQRIVTTNKRSSSSTKKRNSKTLVQHHSESILQQHSSPSNSFAESISGLVQNFDQELLASNFLSQSSTTNFLSQPPTTNILSNESTSTNNINLIRTLDTIDVRQIVNTTIQRTDSSYPSISTMDEYHERLDHETNQTIQDYNVDNEQIGSFINEEEMNFVEMNFDENAFLKQFDLDDSQLKLNINSEQNLFTSLLTSNHHHLTNSIEQLTPALSAAAPPPQPPPPPPPPPPSLPPPPPMYPGSSLINNNVFTTVVPLSSQQQSSLNSSFNISRCLPEEGVQLTARHLEPSQVATYESVKYQDILDDLVTVTDQDVLSHVQAAVAANETTDFSFALLEATNEIIKTTEIDAAEEVASTFVDLQYLYPIEQEQELLQKQLEQCEGKQQQIHDEQEEEEEDDDGDDDVEGIFQSNDSPKSVENDNPTITDLTSILQINQVRSPSPIKQPTLPSPAPIDFNVLLPPEPSPVPTPKIDFNVFLPTEPSPSPSPPPSSPPPVIDYNALLSPEPPRVPTPKIDFNTLRPPDSSLPPSVVDMPPVSEPTSRKARIIFEPILSPAQDELVLESGCVSDPSVEKSNSLDNNQLEELLNDPQENRLEEFIHDDLKDHSYEIIENEGQTSPTTNVTVDNLDHLIEEIEEPTKKLLEKNFFHYQKVYHETQKKKPTEQYSPIPSVKLKLKSIYPKHKRKRKHSPSPASLDENLRPPLKIKIRTKLPSPPPSIKEQSPSPPSPPPPPLPKIKIRKPIKKVKRNKKSPPSIDDQLETEAKLASKTEYAGLTRFEQTLAQRYHQQTSPDTRIPPTPGENEDIASIPNKQDTPPTTTNATSPVNPNKKLSHLFNYDGDSLNNNTYITPPPEIDVNIQQQKTSQPISQSPKKMKKSHQNSSNKKEFYSTTKRSQMLPPPPTQPPIHHMDPYAQSFHHFDPRTNPFFNFPFPNPFLNSHSTPTHFHQNPMKYHYPTHQQPFAYHSHLQRQQQYNNPNYMPSHGHHTFER